MQHKLQTEAFDVGQHDTPSLMIVSRRRFAMRTRCVLMLAGWLATVSLPAWAGTDWTKVAAALGKSGTEMPGGVYRVGLRRTDLKVTLDGVELKPALALGSWLAFRTTDDMTMVMGKTSARIGSLAQYDEPPLVNVHGQGTELGFPIITHAGLTKALWICAGSARHRQCFQRDRRARRALYRR
jgi:hypothetical protein